MNSAPPSSVLAERLESVRSAIADSATEAGRDADELTLIVVTKFHPAELVRQLVALGVREFGENRHQEAQAKAAELADLELNWNFIGQLQSKKAKQVRAYAHSIHSIDRDSLLAPLSASEGAIDCFVQVNLTDDPARGGVVPAALLPLVERVLETSGLRLRGLMAVAPLGEHPRRAFARVRELSLAVREVEPAASALSMGMSHDFRDAIAEGATHLRIGSAITGNRPERP